MDPPYTYNKYMYTVYIYIYTYIYLIIYIYIHMYIYIFTYSHFGNIDLNTQNGTNINRNVPIRQQKTGIGINRNGTFANIILTDSATKLQDSQHRQENFPPRVSRIKSVVGDSGLNLFIP